jgi:hypothetical protein
MNPIPWQAPVSKVRLKLTLCRKCYENWNKALFPQDSLVARWNWYGPSTSNRIRRGCYFGWALSCHHSTGEYHAIIFWVWGYRKNNGNPMLRYILVLMMVVT